MFTSECLLADVLGDFMADSRRQSGADGGSGWPGD
jgi:hypothetical protein